jgi:3-hydroxyisobutyrate dehydrogenase-like beta-hydroxyacid dehydrogenase
LADEIKKVGLIGLGKMGLPMGRHMAAKGFAVTGFDLREDARAAAKKAGVGSAATPAAVAKDCDLTIIVVGFDSDVEAAMFSQDGVLAGVKRGAIVAVASTIAPGTMKDIGARAASSGVALLDIPLCRGEGAAEAGKLLVMGGGDKAAFEFCRPAFAAFADAVYYLGPLGCGQVGKMVNNLILWACISADNEGLGLAAKLGVELGPLREALVDSSAGNWALANEIWKYPMPWAEKDMGIVLKEADEARLSLPLCGVVKEVVKGLKIARGEGMPEAGG